MNSNFYKVRFTKDNMQDKKYILKSKKLQKILDDCNSFPNRTPVFMGAALSNFEKVLLKYGIDGDSFDIKEKNFTSYGEEIKKFIIEYMGVSTDKIYEITHPKILDDGVLFFVSSTKELANLETHLWVKGLTSEKKWGIFNKKKERIRPCTYGCGQVLSVTHTT